MTMKYIFILLMATSFNLKAQKKRSSVPVNFVNDYYDAYSNVPTAARLSPFYADSAVIDDPTYDWMGKSKNEIFKNFDRNNVHNHYTWRVDQQLVRGDTLVTEGLLRATYGGAPYEMRFVNIFHFREGKIIKQYDYYDNKEWYKVVDEFNRKKNREKDEAALRTLKTIEWPKAYREQDTVLLDRILAEEFEMIDSDGVSSTKKDQMDYIKANKQSYLSFDFKIERLDLFENNTAVVSGTGTIRNKDKEGEYSVVYQSSNVLVKRNGEWKAIASHISGEKLVLLTAPTWAQVEPVEPVLKINQPVSVAISVTDLESTLKWYQDYLGFSIVTRSDFLTHGIRTATIESGHFQLELVENLNTISKEVALEDNAGKTLAGFGKIVFRVPDVRLLHDRLKQRGAFFIVPLRSSSVDTKDEYFIVQDAEKNWLQFIGFRKSGSVKISPMLSVDVGLPSAICLQSNKVQIH